MSEYAQPWKKLEETVMEVMELYIGNAIGSLKVGHPITDYNNV